MKTAQLAGLWFLYREETNDYNAVASCCLHDEYELGQEDVSGKLVFDVGAHIGGLAVWLAVRGARVVAVEPIPENDDLIRRNATLNGTYVTVVRGAFGTDVISYGAASDAAENEVVHQFIGNISPGVNAIDIDVERLTLTDLVRDYGAPDIIKIDCEGGEWAFFEDEAVLDVPLIVGEWHPPVGEYRGQDDVRAIFEATHDVVFSGPEGGPGGFTARRR